jgi:hypothetical protein
MIIVETKVAEWRSFAGVRIFEGKTPCNAVRQACQAALPLALSMTFAEARGVGITHQSTAQKDVPADSWTASLVALWGTSSLDVVL